MTLRRPTYSSDSEKILSLALRHIVEPDNETIRHHRLLTLVRGWSAKRITEALKAVGVSPSRIQDPHRQGGARGRLYSARDFRAALTKIERDTPKPRLPERRKTWERPSKET